jgi:hypothetical protein
LEDLEERKQLPELTFRFMRGSGSFFFFSMSFELRAL